MHAYFSFGAILVPRAVSLQIEALPAALQIPDDGLVLDGAPEHEGGVVQHSHLLRLAQPLLLCGGEGGTQLKSRLCLPPNE